MAREFEVNIRVTIDSKCKDSDDDIIEELMYGADIHIVVVMNI